MAPKRHQMQNKPAAAIDAVSASEAAASERLLRKRPAATGDTVFKKPAASEASEEELSEQDTSEQVLSKRPAGVVLKRPAAARELSKDASENEANKAEANEGASESVLAKLAEMAEAAASEEFASDQLLMKRPAGATLKRPAGASKVSEDASDAEVEPPKKVAMKIGPDRKEAGAAARAAARQKILIEKLHAERESLLAKLKANKKATTQAEEENTNVQREARRLSNAVAKDNEIKSVAAKRKEAKVMRMLRERVNFAKGVLEVATAKLEEAQRKSQSVAARVSKAEKEMTELEQIGHHMSHQGVSVKKILASASADMAKAQANLERTEKDHRAKEERHRNAQGKIDRVKDRRKHLKENEKEQKKQEQEADGGDATIDELVKPMKAVRSPKAMKNAAKAKAMVMKK